MKKVIGLAVATMAAGLVALPAAAQKGNDDMAPARLEALDAQAKAASFHIMHARAVEIAKANGLVSIREVELEHGSNWKWAATPMASSSNSSCQTMTARF